MTKKKDTESDKRIDDLIMSVNNIQENMASKEFVLTNMKELLGEYHNRFNPNNLVVQKPAGMRIAGEDTQHETPVKQEQKEKGKDEKKDWSEELGAWGGAAKEGLSLLKTLVVPARDPRFDDIESMSIDIVRNSMTGLVQKLTKAAMADGATIHSGMRLHDQHN